MVYNVYDRKQLNLPEATAPLLLKKCSLTYLSLDFILPQSAILFDSLEELIKSSLSAE